MNKRELIGTALKAVASLALLLTSSPARAGNGFKAMAKELSKDAKRAGIERVAILPFVSADGGSSSGGWNISEKLTTQVVNNSRIQVVERSLLKKLFEEHHLGQTGVLEQPLLKKLGKVFAVEGIITGSFVASGESVVVQARLINIETGVIISASESQIAREGFDSPKAALEAPAPPIPLSSDSWSNFQDSAADDTCVNAAEKVDALNKEILDVKTRYWALQLKKGISISGLRHNPGSEITDPIFKKEFYDRIRAWYVQENIPALTPDEVKRFVDTDLKAFGLYRECGKTPWFVARK
jgi:TolB-like protein